jgi:hypothetical protein
MSVNHNDNAAHKGVTGMQVLPSLGCKGIQYIKNQVKINYSDDRDGIYPSSMSECSRQS